MNKLKTLISKIKNKKLRGNISLLVILILLSTSIIALLSINQIQHLMTYGNQTYNYFRAYYLAKAGTEVGLTELYHHEDGFESSIASGHSVISGNFLGEDGKYAGFEPYFTMNISGNFNYITNDPRNSENCTNDNKITLQPGEGIMLALFSDNKTNPSSIKELLTGSTQFTYHNKSIYLTENLSDLATLGLFDENYKNIHVIKSKDLSSILNNYNNSLKTFLTIKNPNDNTNNISFCIKSDEKIASPNSLITTIGHYGDMEVGLQTVIKKSIPSWSLDVLGVS